MTEKFGSFIIDLEGQTLSSEDREIIAHPLVAGVMLFSRNYDCLEQLQSLCCEIRQVRTSPLLILADQEGGRVQRFRRDFTSIPPMGVFGEMYAENAKLACQSSKACAWLMAKELLNAGLDASLAPVLDLKNANSKAIGDRAFDANPSIVIELAAAFIDGMREAGMTATGKHFPGHGSVRLDSHVTIPLDTRSYQQIEAEDASTFTTLIQEGLPAIMAAHIIFSHIDDRPVTYSKRWLKDILRQKFGFKGLILSDDLNMEGANISPNYDLRFIEAREAGCDLVILCNNREGVNQVLNSIKPESHYLTGDQWKVLQRKPVHDDLPLMQNPRWRKINNFLQALNEMGATGYTELAHTFLKN